MGGARPPRLDRLCEAVDGDGDGVGDLGLGGEEDLLAHVLRGEEAEGAVGDVVRPVAPRALGEERGDLVEDAPDVRPARQRATPRLLPSPRIRAT